MYHMEQNACCIECCTSLIQYVFCLLQWEKSSSYCGKLFTQKVKEQESWRKRKKKVKEGDRETKELSPIFLHR